MAAVEHGLLVHEGRPHHRVVRSHQYGVPEHRRPHVQLVHQPGAAQHHFAKVGGDVVRSQRQHPLALASLVKDYAQKVVVVAEGEGVPANRTLRQSRVPRVHHGVGVLVRGGVYPRASVVARQHVLVRHRVEVDGLAEREVWAHKVRPGAGHVVQKHLHRETVHLGQHLHERAAHLFHGGVGAKRALASQRDVVRSVEGRRVTGRVQRVRRARALVQSLQDPPVVQGRVLKLKVLEHVSEHSSGVGHRVRLLVSVVHPKLIHAPRDADPYRCLGGAATRRGAGGLHPHGKRRVPVGGEDAQVRAVLLHLPCRDERLGVQRQLDVELGVRHALHHHHALVAVVHGVLVRAQVQLERRVRVRLVRKSASKHVHILLV
mmetsp:Transcript_41854/g.80002  ORF Transcript_41854/g.80002 Transcript_41854/m.80002 type:complete len:375 (-) Transcript_41854:3343-4467(-)